MVNEHQDCQNIPLTNQSDFVTSASCVPDDKNPKRKNNSWHVSHRMQRSIDQSEHAYSTKYHVRVISVAVIMAVIEQSICLLHLAFVVL